MTAYSFRQFKPSAWPTIENSILPVEHVLGGGEDDRLKAPVAAEPVQDPDDVKAVGHPVSQPVRPEPTWGRNF